MGRHPFSWPAAADLRLGVAARTVGAIARAPASATSPGRRDLRRAGLRGGGQHQIWIAGGIGITPFMSWIRALDDSFDRDVAFFYSVAGNQTPCTSTRSAPRQRPTRPCTPTSSLKPHGYLTAEQAAQQHDQQAGVSVYTCGPPAMMTALSKAFRSWYPGQPDTRSSSTSADAIPRRRDETAVPRTRHPGRQGGTVRRHRARQGRPPGHRRDRCVAEQAITGIVPTSCRQMAKDVRAALVINDDPVIDLGDARRGPGHGDSVVVLSPGTDRPGKDHYVRKRAVD